MKSITFCKLDQKSDAPDVQKSCFLLFFEIRNWPAFQNELPQPSYHAKKGNDILAGRSKYSLDVRKNQNENWSLGPKDELPELLVETQLMFWI